MRQRSAFTLVELLVVIAILALLASLLLPVLQSAVESGRSVVCSNNQHQLGVAFTQYAESFYNHFPRTRTSPGEDGFGNKIWTSNEKNQDGWARVLAISEFNLDLLNCQPRTTYETWASKAGRMFVCPTSLAKVWSYGGVTSNWCLRSVHNYNGNPGWSSDAVYDGRSLKLKWNNVSRSDFPLLIDTGVDDKFLDFHWTGPRDYFDWTYAERGFDFYKKIFGGGFIRSFPGFWHGPGGKSYPLEGTANQLCIDGSVRTIDARSVPRYWSNSTAASFNGSTHTPTLPIPRPRNHCREQEEQTEQG